MKDCLSQGDPIIRIEWECYGGGARTKRLRWRSKGDRPQYLTLPQINTLLEKAKKDDHPIIYPYPFILIALETSMRRMEILSIRIENIYLGRQLIYIHHAKAGPVNNP